MSTQMYEKVNQRQNKIQTNRITNTEPFQKKTNQYQINATITKKNTNTNIKKNNQYQYQIRENQRESMKINEVK